MLRVNDLKVELARKLHRSERDGLRRPNKS